MMRRLTLLLFAVGLVTACGVASSSAPDTLPTVPVGELPAPVTEPDPTAAPDPANSVVRSTTTLAPEQQVGARVSGNRVILIGDSVMASTSRRYSNDMCNALVPLGWQVEVDAETSRFIQFGHKVLDKRLSAGWDASVILLGNNYGGNQDEYRRQLDKMVERLSPDPVVLLTVSEFTPSRAEVNEVINEMAAKYANVQIVDWAKSTADQPEFTGADGLHLTTLGREGLATNVAFALGAAPVQPGKCLSSSFRDDSGGPVTGTTAKPGTVTTKKPTSSTSTTDGSGGGDTTVTTTKDTAPSSSTGGSGSNTTVTVATSGTTAPTPPSSVAAGGPVPDPPPVDPVTPAP
jgi:hypothetical protein